jgi:lysophospholipase L1-like esterase
LNLGFGGSTLEACNHFFARLVPPVRPRSLLVYAGDNDLGDGRSADAVAGYFRSLATKVAASLNGVPFGFISIKPSPARYPLLDRIRGANELIRREIAAIPSAYYVDVFSAMLNSSGKSRADLFLEDGLHLNRSGYHLWGKLLQPFRDKILTV